MNKILNRAKHSNYVISAISLSLVLVWAVVLPVLQVRALSDTTPMELVDLQVDMTEIDVSDGSVEVNISGEMFEDVAGSGFESAEFFYTSPSGQLLEYDASSDEQYIDETIEFPEYAESGVWRPTFTLVDYATNSITYTPDDLVSLGFDVDITVTSDTPDLTVPTLDDMVFSTNTLDTENGAATMNVYATIFDDLSGIGDTREVIFSSPSGGQETSGFFMQELGSDYSADVTFPQYAETGVWTAQVVISDLVTNTAVLDANDLDLAGYSSTISITGDGDATPITIESLDFDAILPPLNPGNDEGNGTINIVGGFSDNLSGVQDAILKYYSQSSTQMVTASRSVTGSQGQFTAYLPYLAAEGQWLPELSTTDVAGNSELLSHTDLVNLGFDLSINLDGSDTTVAIEDETVTTDSGGDGATSDNPFEAAITTPNAGVVTISELGLSNPTSVEGYLVFDQQFDIEAPAATIADPLVFSFSVDVSNLNGETASSLAVFRNGILVEDCLVTGTTDPDPCVSERNTLGDGDVELVVLSSEASVWSIGHQLENEAEYTFNRFKRPVRNAPRIKIVKAGRAIPVKFDVGGDFGLDILDFETVTSQRINCTTKQTIGNPVPINLTRKGDLSINDNDIYRFNWKTLRRWDNSCRQLTLDFSNGETISAYFYFF